MSLRRQSGGPERYSGGGSIRQTSHGGIEFVLYDTKAEVSLQEIIPQGESGEWLTSADFWKLSATDVYGHVWQAEWADAGTSITAGEPGAIVRGSCDRVTCNTEERPGKGSDFHAFAPTTRQVPVNAITETVQMIDGRSAKSFSTNLWKVDCGEAGTVLATQLDDGIDVHLSSEKNELPPQMGERLAEALNHQRTTRHSISPAPPPTDTSVVSPRSVIVIASCHRPGLIFHLGAAHERDLRRQRLRQRSLYRQRSP